jgi:hypothetical protein
VEANLVEEALFFLSCLLRKRGLGSSFFLTLVPRPSSTTHTHTHTQRQFLLGCLLHVFWSCEGFVKGFLATIKFARKRLEVNKLSAASCHDVQEMTEEAFIAR